MSSYMERAKNKLPDRPKTGIRAKASSMVGRNKESNNGPTTVARPLSDLRDPASFAPPPKRTGTGLEPAPPPSSASRKVITSPSKYHDPRDGKLELPSKIAADAAAADTGGQRLLEDEDQSTPSQPYKIDSTGLQTNHLPAPPRRRDGADGRIQTQPEIAVATTKKPPPPGLPPRLPARGGSSTASATPQTPRTTEAASSGGLNRGAISRLGASGISVPGFGIGSVDANNSTTSRPPPPPPRADPGSNAQLNELQGRFSKLGTASSPSPANSPSQGTTWAQKQAALKTASSFNKDPSSVSLSDAKAAASTANNFRQRHGEQVAAGLKSANDVNKKHGIMDKAGGIAARADQRTPPSGDAGADNTKSPSSMAGLAAKKKPPPPPPPKKKPGLLPTAGEVIDVGDDEPPPVPMATRPVF